MDLSTFSATYSSAESALCATLRKATWQRTRHGRLMSTPATGRALAMVSRMVGPTTILELGTFTGYGTLCLLEGLRPGGNLHTVERNDELFALQDEHWQRHPRCADIRRHHADALEVLRSWQHRAGTPIDLAYIDADKQGVNDHLDALLPLMADDGWMLFDNTWWNGTLEGRDAATGPKANALRALNHRLRNDASLNAVVLPIGDGLTVVNKA